MSTVTDEVVVRRRHTLSDILHERTHFEFIERAWRWALISGTLVFIAVVALVAGGLNLGIDFDGGTQWQVTVGKAKADPGRVRDVVAEAGLRNAKVLIIAGDQARVQAEELPASERDAIRAALADYAGVDQEEVSLTNVGPTWGDQVTNKALLALVVFFGLIAAYLTWRFEWRMAVAAIAAVVHDIIITAGVYAVTRFEVVPATVVAFLTILGFSLYDTVVVFDKVRENVPTIGSERSDTYSRMVNRSMNQVLMRSLNTSFVAVLPVFSLLVVGSFIFGAVTLRDFALALTVGLLIGAYSSIFVATPILAWLKEREPRYVALRERSAAQAARGGAARPSAVSPPRTVRPTRTPDPTTDDAPSEPEPAPERAAMKGVARPGPSPSATTPVTPRPRQPRRRKRR